MRKIAEGMHLYGEENYIQSKLSSFKSVSLATPLIFLINNNI